MPLFEKRYAVCTASTRLFNKARTIEDKLLPWIDTYLQSKKTTRETTVGSDSSTTSGTPSGSNPSDGTGDTSATQGEGHTGSFSGGITANGHDNTSSGNSAGGSRNLPYFFQGINYSGLDPNDGKRKIDPISILRFGSVFSSASADPTAYYKRTPRFGNVIKISPRHCEPVTDVTGVAIRNLLCLQGEDGFQRQCAHWLGMTESG